MGNSHFAYEIPDILLNDMHGKINVLFTTVKDIYIVFYIDKNI